MRRTYTRYNAIPGLDVTEFYDTTSTDHHPMSHRPYKRLVGFAIFVFILALLSTAVTEVRATEWYEQPKEQTNINTTNDSDSKSKSNADANSTSVSSANSGSTSGASSGSTAVTGPSTSGAVAAGGSTGPVNTGANSGSTASNGPINVAPATSMNSNSRALALAFPAPVQGVISASNCLVAGNRGLAIGFNFFSTTRPEAFSDPICTLRAMAAEADAACQYRTAAEMRSEAMAIVLKRDARPVPDTLVDLSAEQCLMLKQPRIVMPQASTTFVDASQWQTQDVQPPAAAQSQQATPSPAPAPAPTRRRITPPAPAAPAAVVPAMPTCAPGETTQCVQPRPAPGSFSDIIRR